jgi:predicted flavoprotein YhiN
MADYLPVRFVNKYLQRELSETSLNELSDVSIRRIGEMINSWQVKFSDTEGWHKAEVTLGGVDTDMILSKTMESRIVSGLYFIGEVLDVTGWLGGYNFQWAWSSGYACGSSIGE